MDFLRFSLHLIDCLAWPVVALGYPICASIRAIETGSKYHMRKLVIYWTIFSFISLFQHLFDKLIQWVPLWPHIKLITICWLVIPRFNGACYLYEVLVRPCLLVKWHDSISQFNSSCYVYLRLSCLCLSVNLRTVAHWFNKPMEDQSLKNETFLSVVEGYLKENGSDALEKHIANKYKDYSSKHHAEEIKPTDTSDEAGRITPNQTQCEGSGPVWEDITVMEHMAKHEAAEPKQVKSLKENPIIIEKKTKGLQVRELVVPADAEEINFQRKHKAKYEGLKTCEQTSKSDGSLPVPTKSNQLNLEQVKHASAAQPQHSANEAVEPKQVKIVKDNPIQIEKKTTGLQVKEMVVPAVAEEFKLPEVTSSKKVQTEWTSALCEMTTTLEQSMKSHLNGRKHKAKCEGLKTCEQTSKSDGIPVPTKLNQFNLEQVTHVASAQPEHSAN
ncbi:hypothetical protein MTR67_044997 [Solanum verrucosum]|uniref:C2H2-type domain-containing protein n=1 Tax=Solanum verrucosum TaxID=315347 RepID=A0AAF0USI4_SOLVR|nr:hypothetical protein MTR67_044997 [Solanum verrucosum]